MTKHPTFLLGLSYIGIISVSTFVLVAALGPGLFTHNPASWYGSWQQLMFQDLCHQMPSRSYTINGVQMAVCSRCLGIYSGIWLGTIVLPPLGMMIKRGYSGGKILLGGSFLIIIIDFTGNGLHIWTNTDLSRLITGIVLGVSVIYFLCDHIYRDVLEIKKKASVS